MLLDRASLLNDCMPQTIQWIIFTDNSRTEAYRFSCKCHICQVQEERESLNLYRREPSSTSSRKLYLKNTAPCSIVQLGLPMSNMVLRSAGRVFSRRLATAAEAMDKSATKGPKLPAGNDSSSFHDAGLAVGT